MPDALTTITKLINSPPGQLAAGAVLAGIVWKFFERVEAVLNDNTKLEIAVWLLGVKIAQRVEPWPSTFIKLFDRVFGEKHVSWRCFWRSCIVSFASVGLVVFAYSAFNRQPFHVFTLLELFSAHRIHSLAAKALAFFGLSLFGNVVLDYLSLLKARYLLKPMTDAALVGMAGLLSLDLLLTVAVASLSLWLSAYFFFVMATWNPWFVKINGSFDTMRDAITLTALLRDRPSVLADFKPLWFYPAFFTSIWLWLYAGSGFLLKAARRFDIGFDWFNRHFDIEKKPLQCIGLVAGALVAVVYWAVVIVSRVVG